LRGKTGQWVDPGNVFDNIRAIVTAGLAKLVERVNQ
jgi:hypothetical protein